MKNRLTLRTTLLAVVLLSACDSAAPDDDHAGEEELITRIELTLIGNGETVTATATDSDGDGTGIEVTAITLTSGVTYDGTLAVFDDINDVNVTEEIEEEAEEHQFFFTPAGGISTRMMIAATDLDENQLPVGLAFSATVSAGGSVTGTLRVRLSHFDETVKDGTSLSDETDIDVTFPVTIQ